MGKLVGFVKGIRTPDAVKGKTCLFPFSIGQLYHEKDKLTAAMQFGCDYFTPEHCFAVCCDTLQAETKSIGKPDEEHIRCVEEAREDGTVFLERNHKTLEIIGKERQNWLTRWDYWTALPEYQGRKELIDSMYVQDAVFRGCVDRSVRQFLRNMETLSPDAYEKSVNYIKIECAVAFLWADKIKPNFIVYPMEINEAMQYIFNKIRADAHNSEIMLPLHLSFVSKPNQKEKITTERTQRNVVQKNKTFFNSQPPRTQQSLDEVELAFFTAEEILKQMQGNLIDLKHAYNAALLAGDSKKAYDLKTKAIILIAAFKKTSDYLLEGKVSTGEKNLESFPEVKP